MEDASSNTRPEQPTEMADSSEYDENDIYTTGSTKATADDIDIKKPNEFNTVSLVQCRQSGALVDDFDDDDHNYFAPETQHTLPVDHSEVRTLDGNAQASTNDPLINTTQKKSIDANEESFSSGLSTVNAQSTTTTSTTIQRPICNYLLPHRFVTANTSLLQQSRLLPHSNPPQNWDHILRSGTKIKTLIAEAMGEVKSTIMSIQSSKHNQKKRARVDTITEEDESALTNHRSNVVKVADFTVELAREKTAQVMQLQRQLKDAQAQAAAVQAANASLREETCGGQSRLDRTVEALRIASNNATKARADADAAEVTASALALTLQNLKTVLTETKNASQLLYQEQQELNATVAAAESKFLEKEAELLRAKKEITSLRSSNGTLEATQINFARERETVLQQVKQLEQELDVLKREKIELHTMEQARKDRFDKVEQEWRKTQTLLVEATAGQTAALQTQAALEKTVVELQKANENVHASLKEQQRIARDEKHRLTESLGKVEKEAQRLRIAAEATEEEMARLKANKASTEKQIQQLKSRLSSAERSLKEATIVATTTPMSTNVTAESITTPIIPNQLSFQLPPLTTTTATGKKASTLLSTTTSAVPTITEKENIGVQNGELCCVCYKPSIGIMKICQCGSKQCQKKAHTNCIKFMNTPAGPSVSHPGTPAPKLPIVLCDNHNSLPLTTTKLRSIE